MLRTALFKSSLVCVFGCLTLAAAHADVYKYKDDKGTVLYTDKPMFLPAERLTIKTESSSIVDLDKSNDTAAKPDAAPKKPAASDKKPAQSESNKAELCNKAREDYLKRMNAQRLYEELPNGERKYLDEKELDASRAAAKQAMDTFCN